MPETKEGDRDEWCLEGRPVWGVLVRCYHHGKLELLPLEDRQPRRPWVCPKFSASHIHPPGPILHSLVKICPKEYHLLQHALEWLSGSSKCPSLWWQVVQDRKQDYMQHLRQVAVRLHLAVATFRTRGRDGMSDIPHKGLWNMVSFFWRLKGRCHSIYHITQFNWKCRIFQRSRLELSLDIILFIWGKKWSQGCCLGI